MKVLLDSCALLWLELEPIKVPPGLVEILRDRGTERYLSAASAWEITLKWMSGKLKLPVPPAQFLARARQSGRIASLAIEESAAVQLAKLPRLHTDPFDRMLVCQAIENGLVIATPDELIEQYPVRTVWG
jgi:PIN domain nuclease of toxin-antitoxin system